MVRKLIQALFHDLNHNLNLKEIYSWIIIEFFIILLLYNNNVAHIFVYQESIDNIYLKVLKFDLYPILNDHYLVHYFYFSMLNLILIVVGMIIYNFVMNDLMYYIVLDLLNLMKFEDDLHDFISYASFLLLHFMLNEKDLFILSQF